MKTATMISRYAFFWIILWFLVLGALLSSVGYWEASPLKDWMYDYYLRIFQVEKPAGPEFDLLFRQIFFVKSFILTAFCLWGSLRFSTRRILGAASEEPGPAKEEKGKKEAGAGQSPIREKKAAVESDQRRGLQLLALLQREGRLVDFLEEDLQQYDDGQIGMAVRNIQENCQKALNKYLALEAIIDQPEGTEINIPAGFDASTVKLTGNIAGEPPFTGILQHRGWKSARFDLPVPSGSQNPEVIAPAEVEIE